MFRMVDRDHLIRAVDFNGHGLTLRQSPGLPMTIIVLAHDEAKHHLCLEVKLTVCVENPRVDYHSVTSKQAGDLLSLPGELTIGNGHCLMVANVDAQVMKLGGNHGE